MSRKDINKRKFNYLIKICTKECNANAYKNNYKFKSFLNKIKKYYDQILEEKQEGSQEIVNETIEERLRDYLIKTSNLTLKSTIVNYYLSTCINSPGNSTVKRIYKKLYDMDSAGKIDILNMNFEDEECSYNVEKTLEKIILSEMNYIRREKKELLQIEDIELVIKSLAGKSRKQRDNEIKRFAKGDKEALYALNRAYELFTKSEFEIIYKELLAQDYNMNARREIKSSSIKSILESTKLLDEMGLLELFVENNNKSFKKMDELGISLTLDEVKEALKEENLNKLNIEQLVIMSSFWVNRVNKIIKDLNKYIYILNHKEIATINKLDNGLDEIEIPIKTVNNLDIKLNFLHKLYFDIFNSAQSLVNTDNNTMDITSIVKAVCAKYEKFYKEYFDKLFPNSENSLCDDMISVNVFENLRYNSYEIKNSHMESLLMCLIYGSSKDIENFGYIKENNAGKNQLLIGVDMVGLNMPYALHMNKADVIDFLKETQGDAMFPIYVGSKDFNIKNSDINLKTQLLIPATEQWKTKVLRVITNVKTIYGKTIKHIAYISGVSKMPEHLMTCISQKQNKYKYNRQYVNFEETGVEKEME